MLTNTKTRPRATTLSELPGPWKVPELLFPSLQAGHLCPHTDLESVEVSDLSFK